MMPMGTGSEIEHQCIVPAGVNKLGENDTTTYY